MKDRDFKTKKFSPVLIYLEIPSSNEWLTYLSSVSDNILLDEDLTPRLSSYSYLVGEVYP